MTQSIGFFQNLKPDNICSIASFCDSKTKKEFALTCRTIKPDVDLATKMLSLSIPLIHQLGRKETHAETLINLLKRFPHMTRLSFGKDFSEKNEDIIRSLILFLQSAYPPQLRHIKMCEIAWEHDAFHRRNGNAAQLNRAFFDALSHPQTLSLEVSNYHNGSVITDEMVNSMLAKARSLTSFTFDGFQFSADITLAIRLSVCPNLEKVTLNGMPAISDKTIQHLGLCRKLKELSIDKTWKGRAELEQFLCGNHGLNLTVLNLEDTECFTDDETLNSATEHLPDLEFFARKSLSEHWNRVSDEGLVQLARNCKKLTTLVFNFRHITDKGLRDFARSAPQLRKLSGYQIYEITHMGLQALAQYCSNLEALELIHFSDLTSAVLSALAENCKSLRFLNISFCMFNGITEQDLNAFVDACKSLKYLEISHCKGVLEDSISNLHKRIFPRIERPRFRDFYRI